MPSNEMRSERFLFKIPKSNPGENWAEKVAAEVGLQLGLATMDVRFAVKGDVKGVLLKNFLMPNTEKIDGGELLARSNEKFNPLSLTDYTIERIMDGLDPYQLESNFISLCVFDFLIANQDRHCENWALILDKTGYSFSPFYDNGASLGFSLDNETLNSYLTDEARFIAFTNRSKTIIEVGGKRKPKFKKLLQYIDRHFPNVLNSEIDRLETLDYNKLKQVLAEIPEEWMNSLQKEWVLKLILFRKQWLLKKLWREETT